MITVASSSSAVCTLSGGVITFVGGGTCTLDANQAGNGSYYFAPQVLQSFQVENTQTISFTTPTPTSARVGVSSYTPSASATSGLSPVFTIDGSSTSGACSISGGVISFPRVGTCVVDANQAGGAHGGATYTAAPQVQQSFSIQPTGAVTFSTTAPTNATVGGSVYNVTAITTNNGETVTITSTTPSVCSVGSSVQQGTGATTVVTSLDGGLCVLSASDTVTSATQAYTVAKLQTITFGTTVSSGAGCPGRRPADRTT